MRADIAMHAAVTAAGSTARQVETAVWCYLQSRYLVSMLGDGSTARQVYNEHAGSYSWKRLAKADKGAPVEMVVLSMDKNLEVTRGWNGVA